MSRLPQILHLLNESPEDPFLRFALAKEYESSGQTEEALHAWAWLLDHAPEYNGFYYHYVKLLHAMGQTEKAIEILHQGLKITLQQGDRHAHNELMGLRDMMDGY